jgi:hypothetical protein
MRYIGLTKRQEYSPSIVLHENVTREKVKL